jgi:hypothetical protein
MQDNKQTQIVTGIYATILLMALVIPQVASVASIFD